MPAMTVTQVTQAMVVTEGAPRATALSHDQGGGRCGCGDRRQIFA